jgi:hypothetical protein
MSTPEMIQSHSEIVLGAWGSLDPLLPPHWDVQEVRPGYVLADDFAFRVDEKPPRNMQTLGQRISAHLFRQQPETYLYARRYGWVGQLRHDQAYIDNLTTQPEELRTMPPILSIEDERFFPQNPIDYQTSPIRHTRVTHRLGAGVDRKGVNFTYGIGFHFLHTPDQQKASRPRLAISYHDQMAHWRRNRLVDQFLVEQGRPPEFPVPFRTEVSAISEIMQACIREAIAPPVPSRK